MHVTWIQKDSLFNVYLFHLFISAVEFTKKRWMDITNSNCSKMNKNEVEAIQQHRLNKLEKSIKVLRL